MLISHSAFSVMSGQLWGGSQILGIFCVHDIDISALSCDHPRAAQGSVVWGRLWQREQGSKGLCACQPQHSHRGDQLYSNLLLMIFTEVKGKSDNNLRDTLRAL